MTGLALTASAKAARSAERRLALTPVARGQVARSGPILGLPPLPRFWLGARCRVLDRVALAGVIIVQPVALALLFSQRFVTSGALMSGIKD